MSDLQPSLDGMPAEPQRGPVPNDLTRAWCVGYSDARQGKQPHPYDVQRVGRTAKNVARHCLTDEDWYQAGLAALQAGRRGHWDFSGFLSDPQPAQQPVSARQAVAAALAAGALHPAASLPAVVTTGRPVCPECRAGKHGNCDGRAWDDDLDQPGTCTCTNEAHR